MSARDDWCESMLTKIMNCGFVGVQVYATTDRVFVTGFSRGDFVQLSEATHLGPALRQAFQAAQENSG